MEISESVGIVNMLMQVRYTIEVVSNFFDESE